MIKFAHQVTSVTLAKHTRSLEVESDTWRVETADIKTGERTKSDYDAVVVASGHFGAPKIPPIKGLEAWAEKYPGTISHSNASST